VSFKGKQTMLKGGYGKEVVVTSSKVSRPTK
jgi:hypothetical protein